MLVFFNERLVFLATPKAGSTAIEAALEPLASVSVQRPAALKHVTARDYHAFVATWLANARGAPFQTVALMRDPLDWLRSWYRFRLRDDHDDPAHAMEGVSFDQFVRGYVDGPANGGSIGTQTSFLTDAGRPAVDRIFRYENMGAFTDFLEDQLDCVISLPRLNVPPSVDVSLTPSVEDALRRRCAAEFAFYDALPA